MKRVLLSLFLFGLFATASAKAHADSWEIVRKCTAGPCISNAVPTTTSVTIKGYSQSLTSAGAIEWAYFTFYVDNAALTRHMVVFHNITDSRTAPSFKALEDAWRTGKKVRFLRNSDRNAEPAPTVQWQGYMNTMYTIEPGDRVEFIFD